jgi:hypothetical protein
MVLFSHERKSLKTVALGVDSGPPLRKDRSTIKQRLSHARIRGFDGNNKATWVFPGGVRNDHLQSKEDIESKRRLCRRVRAGISGDRPRPDRKDQNRPSHTANRLSRRARRLCPVGTQNGRGRNQQGRRRDGPPARYPVGRLGQPGDRRDQSPAHAGSGWRCLSDGRDQFGICGDHHAGGRAQQTILPADRRPLRRFARQEL